jgi:hypothetical protein
MSAMCERPAPQAHGFQAPPSHPCFLLDAIATAPAFGLPISLRYLLTIGRLQLIGKICVDVRKFIRVFPAALRLQRCQGRRGSATQREPSDTEASWT